MSVIKATWKNGQIVPDEKADWPEGCRLLIEPIPQDETTGLREQDGQDTPEKIAQHLALMDQIEPLIMTPEEEAEWQAAREAQKEFEKALFLEQAEKLRRMWE